MAVPPPQAATVTEEALPDEAVFAAKYAQVGVEERRSALEALEALIAEGVAGAASSGRLKGEITALKLEAEWLRAHPDQGSR
ncbi:MAG: hypothetical protein NTY35_02000 [Planctomycetota bacterium]|nr:hypothetical protein [Planctomycetota bacterium]